MDTNSAVVYTLTEGSVKDVIPSLANPTIGVGGISGIFSGLWLFGIAMCAIAAMAMYAYAGIRYQSVDSGSKEADIKKDLKQATIGIIGVFGLWLLLNQVNPELLRGEISFKQPDGTVSPATGVPVIPQTPVAPGTPTSESNIRTALAAIPININNAGKTCTGGQTSGCTNVQGMRPETIEMLRLLRSGCPTCDIQISGGTEPGHKSHGINLLPVDLSLSPSLDAYIAKEGAPDLGPVTWQSGGGCYRQFVIGGWRFCDEKSAQRHWHVNP